MKFFGVQIGKTAEQKREAIDNEIIQVDTEIEQVDKEILALDERYAELRKDTDRMHAKKDTAEDPERVQKYIEDNHRALAHTSRQSKELQAKRNELISYQDKLRNKLE